MQREYRIKTGISAHKAREEAKTLAALLDTDVEVWVDALEMGGPKSYLAFTVLPSGEIKYSYHLSA